MRMMGTYIECVMVRKTSPMSIREAYLRDQWYIISIKKQNNA